MLRLYINLNNFKDEWLRATGELVAIAPFLSREQQYKYLNGVRGAFDHFYNRDDVAAVRVPLFKKAIQEAKQYARLTSIEDCDLVLLPFKYTHGDVTPYAQEAKSFGKKIIVMFNDDSSEDIPLGEEAVILRTSFYKSRKKNNEYAFPTFSADFYHNNDKAISRSLTITEEEKPTISFCGALTHPLRLQGVEALRKSDNVEHDFIVRDGFWAHGVEKDVAIEQFNANMRNSLYGFCCRGGGNFSFRLGEVLSHGRIPLLVDSDCVLPFEHKINWREHAVIIKESEIDDIDDRLVEFHVNKTSSELMQIQARNRAIWQEYFTPLGFIKHLGDFV